MALSKIPYKGTRDFFPKDMRLRNFIFNKMAKISELFAYEPYDGPLLEDIELYLAKSGEELINEQIYSFKDRGDRNVVIRPEMTPTVARMVAQIHREVSKPLRWYAIPNLMRYEKPQKGRLREFWQYNADIFGAGLHGQIEILQLAVSIMKGFGANHTHFEILINDRNFVDYVFNKLLNLESEEKNKLYKLVDKKNKMDPSKFEIEVSAILQDPTKENTFNQYSSLTSFEDLEIFCQKHHLLSENCPLIELGGKLKNLNLLQYVKFDASIVRGLDYYTGLVFEIFDKNPENRRAIAGGGAYANLLQIFNEPPLEGVGFGMGEVPLTDFLTTHQLRPNFDKQELDYLVGYLEDSAENLAMRVTDELRKLNKKVEFHFGATKLKKLFSLSDKKNFKNMIIIGEEELKNDSLKIKHLESREEQTLSVDSFIQGLK